MGESVRLSLKKSDNRSTESTLLISLVLLCGLISNVLTHPAIRDFKTISSGNLVRRVSRNDVSFPTDPYIGMLERLTENLNPDWFVDDNLVIQRLDKVNKISKYNDPDDNATIVFEREVLDKNKEAVVLSNAEDHRQINGTFKKRTYIVLRKAVLAISPGVSEITLPALYLAAYAYIREARPTSDNVMRYVVVDGSRITIEWDNWEYRSPSGNPLSTYGWLGCAYTILFSCALNQTAVEMALDEKTLEAITLPTNGTTIIDSSSTPSQETEQKPLERIVSEPGFDPDEYIDLYGDFDIHTNGENEGRSLFSGMSKTLCKLSLRGGTCGSGNPKRKSLKIVKVVHDTKKPKLSPYSSYGYGAIMNARPTGQTSNADSIFGIYFQGLPGTPPIFLPDGSQTTVLFVPDSSTSSYTVHGVYIPGTAGFPDTFTADDPSATVNIYSTPGSMIPDGMIMSGITGGIHGMLSGDSFRPDFIGTSMWFNPDGPESKGVWSTYNKTQNNGPKRAKTTADGKLITYGVEFPGTAGSADIFVPDGQGIPGLFVPNDAAKPDFTKIPHGSFVATKPAGHGTFFPDSEDIFILADGSRINQLRGAFMPDGMNLTGLISGLITKGADAGFVFVVDNPGIDFEYYKGKTDTEYLWAPFLGPGEWKPPPAPVTMPSGTAPAGRPAKDKIKNPTFMYGVKFPGMGSLDVFVPDNFAVEGTMTPENPDFDPIPGQLFVNGKQKKDNILFQATQPKILAKLPAYATVIFVPDGIPMGNGIMGELNAGPTKNNNTFTSEPEATSFWYMKGKPENGGIWTPLTPKAAPPVAKKPSIIEQTQSAPFVSGFYFPGLPGEDPVFIPEDGVVGCFQPDDTKLKQSCGSFYSEKADSPSEFVQDIPNSLNNSTSGNFIPQSDNGTSEVGKFHGIFIDKPPGTLISDIPPYKGWSQTTLKIATKNVTSANNKSAELKHSSTTPIPVGSGFSGYPTNGKGLEALVDPNSPIFREFLQWKSRQDKSINQNEKIVIMNNKEEMNRYQSSYNITTSTNVTSKTSFVNLEEYRSYLSDKYSIKTSHIKTEEMNEEIELAVPKAADKYVKKKHRKNITINLDILALASAGGVGGADSATGSSTSSMKAIGGKCPEKFSTSAKAAAEATNGSSANSQADALNGGNARAKSVAKDGSNADSKANVTDGGLAQALSKALNGSDANSTSNALKGGIANSIVLASLQNQSSAALSNAEVTGKAKDDDCTGLDALPEEIEIDSHAVATVLANGTGNGTIINSYANTNVKLDLKGIIEKIKEMQREAQEDGDADDYDDNGPEFSLKFGASAGSNAGGRSFGEEQSEEGGRSVNELNTVRYRPGWKTEYKIIQPNCTLAHEHLTFYGMGSCPYTENVDPPLPKYDDPEATIDFYLKILRLHCMERVKVKIMNLFNSQFLEFAQEGHLLHLPNDNTIIDQPKITDADLRKLSTAFELTVFTRTYDDHRQKKSYIGQPEGTLSRSVQFIREFALNYAQDARNLVPLHYVRLTRNLLITLKSLMKKLYEDRVALRSCSECRLDKEVNKEDSILVMSLIQFFIHGLAPYEKSQENDIRPVFKIFTSLNKGKFEERVNRYDLIFKH